MPLSAADQALFADMKQRELHLKKRQRAVDAVIYETRRYRAVLVSAAGVVVAGVVTGAFLAVEGTTPERSGWWVLLLLNLALGALVGVQLGHRLLRTDRGRRVLAEQESRVREKYSGDLQAGRRWLQFYYRGEDISPYVAQILHFVGGKQGFDSVAAVLAYVKEHRRESTTFQARARDKFMSVAADTNLVVVSSTDQAGQPSSRVMHFVRSDRPGVWYLAMAPAGPKVTELDRGRIALLTPPTEAGATISSNRVTIGPADLDFPAVADLYRAQVPGYLDGMTEDEQQHELVYELTFQSARVDTWLEHEVVEFCSPEPRGPTRS